ncbi:MAG TPA: hypothetical protein VFX42_06610 [Gemmatimonadales bacterium]|nr:hypothetical protein [Gemmatimonadales bacterium]
MRINASTRYATLAALVGALACASNTARTDETAAAKDTTTVGRDTSGQRDTSITPTAQTPSDTFLQNQGAGTPQDTSGYSGIERDTTRQPSQTDTSNMRSDTTGAGGVTDTSKTGGAADTSGYQPSSANPSSGTALDSTGQSTTGDTTGYNQSQQQRDSTSR